MSPSASADPRSRALRTAYLGACRLELDALKPGNVHIHGEGHGMTVADFSASAAASAGPLTTPGLTLGRRIRDAIAATRATVGCNTNLGIVLLAAPLIAATEAAGTAILRRRLAATLATLTLADAVDAYEAIRLAQPAGLGRVAAEDVAAPPSIDLRAAMSLAAPRDRIARQYVTDYGDVFEIGVARLRAADDRGLPSAWAATLAYMDFLAAFPDSHIARKYGAAAAAAVRDEAAALLPALAVGPPEAHADRLLAFDRRLKASGYNPGTSADLTVASLLALACEGILQGTSQAPDHDVCDRPQ
jgi:triphosphoribosyl-dephospho-CoA synthase